MKLPVGTLKANIGAVFLLMALLVAKDTSALEKPEYDVIFENGKIEYRLYKPYLVVETKASDAEFTDAMEKGFDRLFNYISGNNTQQQKIKMTAPVEMARTGQEIAMTSPVQTSKTPDGVRMAFMLPGEFTLDTAPLPLDENVEVNLLPERVVAAIRFSGRWTERNLLKNEARLIDDIRMRELTTVGPSIFAAYHPPFMPPFLRRNEILFELNGSPQASEFTNSGD